MLQWLPWGTSLFLTGCLSLLALCAHLSMCDTQDRIQPKVLVSMLGNGLSEFGRHPIVQTANTRPGCWFRKGDNRERLSLFKWIVEQETEEETNRHGPAPAVHTKHHWVFLVSRDTFQMLQFVNNPLLTWIVYFGNITGVSCVKRERSFESCTTFSLMSGVTHQSTEVVLSINAENTCRSHRGAEWMCFLAFSVSIKFVCSHNAQ